MPEAKKIVIAEYKRKIAGEAIYHADVIFCLDFNAPSRIGMLGDWLTKSWAKKNLDRPSSATRAFRILSIQYQYSRNLSNGVSFH